MSASSSSLSVLSFNTWGLPLASKDTPERLRALADYLAGATAATTGAQGPPQVDLALLQEVWTQEYVELLSRAGQAAGLVHSHTFTGGLLGSGLLVLSRFPIVAAAFLPFTVHGMPLAREGEWLASKGMAHVRVALPGHPQLPSATLDVFNTHTHANWVHTYDEAPDGDLPGVKVPNDSFAPFRVAHFVEAASFIRSITACSTALGCIVAGDFNVPEDHLEMELLRHLVPGLTDAWRYANARPGAAAAETSGNTCGDPDNVYTGSIIGGYVPERIDYILASRRLPVLDCRTVLKRMPHLPALNYSDHYGVHATLGLPPSSSSSSSPAPVAVPAPSPLSLIGAIHHAGTTTVLARAEANSSSPSSSPRAAHVRQQQPAAVAEGVKALGNTAKRHHGGACSSSTEAVARACQRKMGEGLAACRRRAARDKAWAAACGVASLLLTAFVVFTLCSSWCQQRGRPCSHPAWQTLAALAAAALPLCACASCLAAVVGVALERALAHSLEHNMRQLDVLLLSSLSSSSS